MSEQAVTWRGPWLIKYCEIETKDKTMWKRIARLLRYMWKKTKQSFIISYLVNRRRIHREKHVMSCMPACLKGEPYFKQLFIHELIIHVRLNRNMMNPWCHTTGQKKTNNNPAPASSHTPYYEEDFFYSPIVNHLYPFISMCMCVSEVYLLFFNGAI